MLELVKYIAGLLLRTNSQQNKINLNTHFFDNFTAKPNVAPSHVCIEKETEFLLNKQR